MKEDLLKLPISTYVEIITLIESAKRQADELEAVNAAYNDAQKEISTLKSEVKKLEKSNYKMRGKNQKQGAKVLRLENELRTSDTEKWTKYKKEYKNVQS